MNDQTINKHNHQEFLDIQNTALLLNVSPATVRNWLKCGHLPFLHHQNAGYFFHKKDIESIKLKILSGKWEKLNKRANKTKSRKTCIPKEYTRSKVNQDKLNNIVFFIKKHNIDISTALYLVSLSYLKKQKILSFVNIQDIIKKRNLSFSNRQIQKEIKAWFLEIKQKEIKNSFSFLLDCDLPDQRDSLGVLYQSLLFEGEKSHNGSYYTPQQTVGDIAKSYLKPDSKVLDPCCGTGQFLLAFSDTVKNPLNIYGMDCDKTAVRIARLNILIKFKNKRFTPNIFCKNTLFEVGNYDLFSLHKTFDSAVRDFDVIATNPPWGARFSKTEIKALKNIYPEINSIESFSFFLKKSLALLKNKGVMSFILPESVLNVKTHQDIRSIILKKSHIIKIIHLGRIFKNVFTPVIRLDLKKETNLAGNPKLTNICLNKMKYKIPQIKWADNPDFVFDIHAGPYDRKIIDKIYKQKHITLKNKASWALGIVTGDNKKFISNNSRPGLEPVYKGKDVKSFFLDKPSGYIDFRPDNFQQTAPVEKYRAKEKLIYRFISKQLVFAYDDKKRLTLNSANIVIPKVEGYPLKVISALFNSSVYQFIFQKKFSSIKVLRSHIESMPLPLWNTKTFSKIIEMADKAVKEQNNFKKLDDYIMSRFALSQTEKTHILKHI